MGTLRRQLRFNRDFRGPYEETWTKMKDSKRDSRPGVFEAIQWATGRLDMKWEDEYTLVDIFGHQLPVVGYSDDAWQHELRELHRQAIWRHEQSHIRGDLPLAEVAGGYDYDAATVSLKGKTFSKMSKRQKGMLKACICGGLPTFQRLHRAKEVDSPLCPFCKEEETPEHIYWTCPARRLLRAEVLQETSNEERATWPTSFKTCGLWPEDQEVLKWYANSHCLFEEEAGPPPNRTDQDEDKEWRRDGRLVVATDGAGQMASHSKLRACGFGCFFGLGHSHNVAVPLNKVTMPQHNWEKQGQQLG